MTYSRNIKVIFSLTFIIFTTFISTSIVNAAPATFSSAYYNTTSDLPPEYIPSSGYSVSCTDSAGCAERTSECWNDQSVGTSNCGTACNGGNTWTHYDRQGCWQTSYDPINEVEACTTTYTVKE